MRLQTLDHVAVWAPQRDMLAAFLVETCGMHVIDKTDEFTLVGGDARRGKLTLFEAEGPREPGALERVVLSVPDLEGVLERTESANAASKHGDGVAVIVEAPGNLRLGFVQGEPSDPPDLDHLVLNVPDPAATARAFETLGLVAEGALLRVADRHIVLQQGAPREGAQPLLHHIAFLVESAEDAEEEARSRGLEIDRVVDAPNTLAVFVWGPDRIKLEFVEHKPSFSLV